MRANLMKRMGDSEREDARWQSLNQLAGAAALLAVVVALSEIVITFLPGGSDSPDTVTGWFTLLQENWFLGLRNLGLLNIVFTMLAVPIFVALYGVHRQANLCYGTLALIIFIIGGSIFLATNRAFPMLELSRQFAAAPTALEQAAIVAAGQAMLSVGQSHTPGTFLGFFFSELAGLVMSLVILQSHLFSKATAYAGIVGFALLLLFEIGSSFAPSLFVMTIVFGIGGGILEIVWYALIARKLFQLGQASSMEAITASPSQGIGIRHRKQRLKV